MPHKCDNCEKELGKKSAYTSHMTQMGIILICKSCVESEAEKIKKESKKES